MTQRIRDVMTQNPITVEHGMTLTDAARAMRDADIGDVVVTRDGDVCGILTDRDIVVRAVAEDRSPADCKVGDVCTHDLVSVAPDDSFDRAKELMRQRAVRRLPVLEGGRLTGMVSLGDLAIESDGEKILDDISAAKPNR